jgi:ABC-type branched-subunit amino acid transport system substrate-binding protein
VKAALKKHNAEPVAIAGITKGSIDDLDPAIKVVRAADPDAVILVTIGAPIKEIVTRAAAADWKPLFMTLTSDPAVYWAEGIVVAQGTPPFTDASLPTVALYQRLLKKNPEAKPSYSGLEGFVHAMLIVEGLERAGKDLTREKFIASLESIKDFNVGLGKGLIVSFGPDDHKGTDHTFFTVSHDGKPVPLTDWSSLAKARAPAAAR